MTEGPEIKWIQRRPTGSRSSSSARQAVLDSSRTGVRGESFFSDDKAIVGFSGGGVTAPRMQ